MIYTIKKGAHKARPIRTGIGTKLNLQNYRVVFDESCRYDVGLEQDDVNKLFGVGFVRDPLRALSINIRAALGGNIIQEEHHKDSARWGWNYDIVTDLILLHAYCYINSQRITLYMGSVNINEPVSLYLNTLKNKYEFGLIGKNGGAKRTLYFTHNKEWMFPLNPYFGGNIPATHDTRIEMTRI